jgi:NADPH:quinone reductase-like Zn-dependent oxidoreductase
LRIGFEGAGVVVAIGSGVKSLKVGDEVYGCYFTHPAFNGPDPAWASDYALGEESLLLIKPRNITFEEAASFPGLAITAYQSFKRGIELGKFGDSLAGKTVYVPGALSGTGSYGVQIAKNVFGAEKIISTVSTPKMPLVKDYIPGVVDQLIDYKTQKLEDHIPKGSVDFVYNTQWETMRPAIPFINPKTGVLISVSSIPPSRITKVLVNSPWWMNWMLDLFQLWYSFLLRSTKIQYEMISGNPNIREDWERVGELIALGKIKPVMTVVSLDDIEAVRAGCEMVNSGKGGIGKLVIKII